MVRDPISQTMSGDCQSREKSHSPSLYSARCVAENCACLSRGRESPGDCHGDEADDYDVQHSSVSESSLEHVG